jgi:hypothetical protein
MTILHILEEARRRNAAEQYYIYTQSAEGKAAAEELNRLRAECDKAEANYLATCARHDAERAAQWTEAEANEFGDHRSNEEVAEAYPRKIFWMGGRV